MRMGGMVKRERERNKIKTKEQSDTEVRNSLQPRVLVLHYRKMKLAECPRECLPRKLCSQHQLEASVGW